MIFFYDFWLVSLKRIRIRESKMKLIQTNPDPQHWFKSTRSPDGNHAGGAVCIINILQALSGSTPFS